MTSRKPWERPTPENKTAGEWDWWSQLHPRNGVPEYRTFTVACFQWVPRGRTGQRSDLKMGKVQKRFTCQSHDPETGLQKARDFCAEMNEKGN